MWQTKKNINMISKIDFFNSFKYSINFFIKIDRYLFWLQLEHLLEATILWPQFQPWDHHTKSHSAYTSTHLIEVTWRVESGQNFCASRQLQTIVAPLEAEFQQFSQIKEGSFKLQHKLATMEITGRISTSMRKHGITLSWCNMLRVTR